MQKNGTTIVTTREDGLRERLRPDETVRVAVSELFPTDRRPRSSGRGRLSMSGPSATGVPASVPCVRDHLELLAPVQTRPVDMGLEGHEAPNGRRLSRVAFTPSRAAASRLTSQYDSASSLWRRHRYTSHARASTSCRESPRCL